MPLWRLLLAPLAIAAGYATAILLVGEITPRHHRLITGILTRQAVTIATGFLFRG